jgi:predicted DsbA family dithiol-disulfide isomerase
MVKHQWFRYVKRPRIKAGLEKDEIETVLHSDAYGEAVKKDIEMAQNVGVQGVPFFSSRQ